MEPKIDEKLLESNKHIQVIDIDDPFVSITKHGVLVFSLDMKEIMKERDNGAGID